LCVSAGQGIKWSTNPGAGARAFWRSASPDGSTKINAISCTRTSFCVAVDAAGQALISTDPGGGRSAWRKIDIDGSLGLTTVSCAGTSFCAAIDTVGRLVYSKHPADGASAWHVTTLPSALGNPMWDKLRCRSASFCFAVGPSETMFSANPAGGTSAWDASYGGVAVSCPSLVFCATVDRGGDVATSRNPAGGLATWHAKSIDSYGGPAIATMACPTASLCVGSDSAGNLITSTHPDGGAADWHYTPFATSIEYNIRRPVS
jgi:hypothetical protein